MLILQASGSYFAMVTCSTHSKIMPFLVFVKILLKFCLAEKLRANHTFARSIKINRI